MGATVRISVRSALAILLGVLTCPGASLAQPPERHRVWEFYERSMRLPTAEWSGQVSGHLMAPLQIGRAHV